MQSAAAYYVLVATDLANDHRAASRWYAVAVPRRSFVDRVGTFLDGIFRTRRAAAQPV